MVAPRSPITTSPSLIGDGDGTSRRRNNELNHITRTWKNPDTDRFEDDDESSSAMWQRIDLTDDRASISMLRSATATRAFVVAESASADESGGRKNDNALGDVANENMGNVAPPSRGGSSPPRVSERDPCQQPPPRGLSSSYFLLLLRRGRHIQRRRRLGQESRCMRHRRRRRRRRRPSSNAAMIRVASSRGRTSRFRPR